MNGWLKNTTMGMCSQPGVTLYLKPAPAAVMGA
jgi:hypothetical protein